jgi:hypothetical protein
MVRISLFEDRYYNTFHPQFGKITRIQNIALKSLHNTGINSALPVKGKRLYCCFIDYIKAFDSVSHVKIWLPLVRSGITGKLLKVIKSMY